MRQLFKRSVSNDSVNVFKQIFDLHVSYRKFKTSPAASNPNFKEWINKQTKRNNNSNTLSKIKNMLNAPSKNTKTNMRLPV